MAHVTRKISRPPRSLVEGFARLAPADVYEAMGKQGALDTTIRPLLPGMRLCGPAVTVRTHVGDMLMVVKAIGVAEAGDVIVAEVGDSPHSVCWGGTSSLAAKFKGLAGVILNGSARDLPEIRDLGFPVFARGLSVRGNVKESLGVINQPVAIGGVVVGPGDIVLGDDDGVVVVPLARAEEVLETARAFAEKVEKVKTRLRAGEDILDVLGVRVTLTARGMAEE